MKQILLLAILAGFFSGCVKQSDLPSVPEPVEGSQILPVETINTRLAGFVTKPDNTFFDNVLLHINQWPQYVNVTKGEFISGNVSTDKYITHLILSDPLDHEQNKTLALTPAALNYVRVKPMQINTAGTLHIGSGGQYAFDNGGSLTIPPNAIYEQPHWIYPGRFDPATNVTIRIGYINPLSPDFAISSPCYSMADNDNKRWFLSSLGVVRLTAGTIWMPEDESIFDFDPIDSGSGILKMPIPANLTTELPDSVPLWRLSNGRWIKSVMAKKSGEFYTATISKMSAYNLAIPVEGVYRTIRLRTNAGTPVLNATIKIKYQQAVVAEAQTDWEGNALVFLPADQDLSLEIYAVSLRTRSPVHTVAISTATATKQIDITVNSSLSTMYTFKGNAETCNGTAITRGEIILHNPVSHTVDWHIPVTNGSFNAAIIEDPRYFKYVYYAKLIDQVAEITGSDTAFIAAGGSTNTYTLNTCPPLTALYMNFSIDGAAISITGDLSHADDPPLKAFAKNDGTMISTANNNGQGLQFTTNATLPGVYTGSGIDGLYVNGEAFFHDVNKPMRVTFERYDLQPEGIISGSADFWYRDKAGMQHHVEATFRLSRK